MLDIRPVIPTSADVSSEDVPAAFWNAMATEGVTAGMHDGYQQCMRPDLGVEIFDLDRYGVLVNPAFDAGYRAGSDAIASSCDALAADYLSTNDGFPDAQERHRVATVGSAFDTVDAHPDFGKGFDAGERAGTKLACDIALLTRAQPPADWQRDYPSEFQSGFRAGLKKVERACG